MSAHPWETEEGLLARLRSGDESAFAALVDALHPRLEGLARTFTSSPALAEDVVQETWLAVIRGLHGFEARSSLRTWIFSILVRRARTLAAREARRADNGLMPGGGEGSSAVEWEPGRGRVGLWEKTPVPWGLADPAAIYQSREVLEVVRAALSGLPEAQQRVVMLCDVEGLTAKEVCNILELSETNRRVLLHRGRSRVRRAIDRYVEDGARPPRAEVQEGRSLAAGRHARVDEGGEAPAVTPDGSSRESGGDG